MSVQKKAIGVTLASAAAALFIAGSTVSVAPTAAKASEVKCSGINTCKGTSACASATNSCKGLNECKGHGWLPAASADDCMSQGGTVVE
ncbi:hypothetical protein HH303_13115 [Rhodospirillaceae bacterium KN72]|uniref:Silver efflux pump n=1 Tax=Pacificispira spongiicola TaxID=2729598 RepID=A0A7Y0HGZ7_9PROT|nr:hypothetical protein [Pacificispira spongiicola]NMM45427.1 hypothetical protein [Pacificispira spongiicola]